MNSRASLSESQSYRGFNDQKVAPKSARIEYYDSAGESCNGELRENYDELSLVFDNQTKQWKGPLKEDEQHTNIPDDLKAFRGSH